LTGEVKKGNGEERKKYLARKRRQSAPYRSLDTGVLAKAQGSEDAFDALVSVMEMTARRDDFPHLNQAKDRTSRIEGSVWGAGTVERS